MTTIKCSICKQEYEQSDFEENHLSTKHGITGPIVEYLVHIEQRIKADSDQISRLTNIVESLQSQIKQIDQGRSGSSIRKNKSAAKTKKNKEHRKNLKERRVQRENKEF